VPVAWAGAAIQCRRNDMFKKNAVVAFRLPVLLVIAWYTTLCTVQAQDVTLMRVTSIA
jgi:hypothetical protein